MDNLFDDIDAYLDGLLASKKQTLEELFKAKTLSLKITPTNAAEIMGVQSRTLKGILTGTQKLVDVRVLITLANFLQLPKEQVFELFLASIEKNFPSNVISSQEISFIKENFDLAVLKKAGLIRSITDFEHIRNRINARLGLRSIFEYRKPNIDIAFSSGTFKPEHNLTRAFWIKSAQSSLSEINNPHAYNREGLIKLFPRLRWHTMNVGKGLLEVAKLLYELGITILYQAPLQTLQLRGATFDNNGKPSIVLTNYRGFYATLWFALIHELYHVLFDWEEIKANRYHLTDDSNELLSVQEREREANEFARKYLFSKEKMNLVKPYLNDAEYVAQFASDNHIHPSIIYVLNAFDTPTSNRSVWARAKKYSPIIEDVGKPLNLPWENEDNVEKAIPQLAHETYTK